MKTEHLLAFELKKLMSEMSLDDISVSTLTDRCKLSRKTFYYHFHDIFDLLTLVFLDEKIKDIEETKTIEDIIKVIFSYYIKNQKFLDATISSAGKVLIQEFFYNNFYKGIFRIINSFEESKKLKPNDKKSIARFYALGYSYSIITYFSTHKNKTIDKLLGCFSFESNDNIFKAVRNLIKYKEKDNA